MIYYNDYIIIIYYSITRITLAIFNDYCNQICFVVCLSYIYIIIVIVPIIFSAIGKAIYL
jgi:hypothetical protein